MPLRADAQTDALLTAYGLRGFVATVRWVGRWWLAAVEIVLVVAGVGALVESHWMLLIVCFVLQVGVAGTRRSFSRRTPPTSRMPEDRAGGAVVQGGHSWVGSASLPGRLRVGPLNVRVNVGKNAAEMTLVGQQLSLHIRGYDMDAAMGTPLVDLTPRDGAAVFPARPFLSGRALGIQPVGTGAYYFFPRQRNREQILLALQAEGFRVEARERRPSKS